MRRNHSVEEYEVGGEQVRVRIKVLKRRLVATIEEQVTTAEGYGRAKRAIVEDASLRSRFSKTELLEGIGEGEDPHAEALLRLKRPFQLGFDLTRGGLGFFVEHEELPPNEELVVLTAPGEFMSRSDPQKAARIRTLLARHR